jgi:hypothetical protein
MSAAEVESLAASENCGVGRAGAATAAELGAAALAGAFPGRARGSGSPAAEGAASRSAPVSTKSALKAGVGVCVIKVYALLVGRPWREPKYSYLIAFYEELRAGTIGRDRGKKAASGAPRDIIAVPPSCADIRADGGVRRLPTPSASLVSELRMRLPGTGAARQQAFQLCEGAMGTFFAAAFPVNNGPKQLRPPGLLSACNRPY